MPLWRFYCETQDGGGSLCIVPGWDQNPRFAIGMPVDVGERLKEKADLIAIERARQCMGRTDKCMTRVCVTCDCFLASPIPVNDYLRLHFSPYLGMLQGSRSWREVLAPGRVTTNSGSARCRKSFPPQDERSERTLSRTPFCCVVLPLSKSPGYQQLDVLFLQ